MFILEGTGTGINLVFLGFVGHAIVPSLPSRLGCVPIPLQTIARWLCPISVSPPVCLRGHSTFFPRGSREVRLLSTAWSTFVQRCRDDIRGHISFLLSRCGPTGLSSKLMCRHSLGLKAPMCSSSLPFKHLVVSNLGNSTIMSSWLDREERYDDGQALACVMGEV